MDYHYKSLKKGVWESLWLVNKNEDGYDTLVQCRFYGDWMWKRARFDFTDETFMYVSTF